MPSFSGRTATVTISSRPRPMALPPPRVLEGLVSELPFSSPPEPNPEGLRPSCSPLGNSLLALSYDPHPPPPLPDGTSPEGVSPAKVEDVDPGSSEWVVNALVVLDVPRFPSRLGLAAVTALGLIVASLLTV